MCSHAMSHILDTYDIIKWILLLVLYQTVRRSGYKIKQWSNSKNFLGQQFCGIDFIFHWESMHVKSEIIFIVHTLIDNSFEPISMQGCVNCIYIYVRNNKKV